MNGQTEVAVAVILLALVAALAWLVVSAWHRALQNDGLLPIFHALKRMGVARERIEGTREVEQLAQAARRCAFCGHKMECLAALAASPDRRFLRFCPNAVFLARASSRG